MPTMLRCACTRCPKCTRFQPRPNLQEGDGILVHECSCGYTWGHIRPGAGDNNDHPWLDGVTRREDTPAARVG
jgi:hypothetical protein